jgi:hypothetical protein
LSGLVINCKYGTISPRPTTSSNEENKNKKIKNGSLFLSLPTRYSSS